MAKIGGRRLKDRGKPCPYCGQPMAARGAHRPTPDHIRAKSKGYGLGTNVLYVCWRCNQDKYTYSLAEWLERLRAANDPRAAHVAKVIKEGKSKIHADFTPDI